jgi:superfamily I DNA/RNA helicase
MNLTEEQRRAVEHGSGPACVIAGAGTGKTTALTERLVWLVEQRGLDPRRILATTFTRKATAELYDRAYRRLGERAQQLCISTIDAFVRDLSLEVANRGFMRSARLLDDAQRRVLLLKCAWEVIGKPGDDSRDYWFNRADKIGLVGLLEKSARAHFAFGSERRAIAKSIRSELKEKRRPGDAWSPQSLDRAVRAYFRELKQQGATDHDSLSNDLLRCLGRRKKLAIKFAARFDAIVVDEFQDTSRVQTEILLLLAGPKRNIWVVGDPCQQIYEWRGAGPGNLDSFVKRTHSEKYYLTENWRSRQPILDCAYRFLSRRVPDLKKDGMLKHLRSKRDESDAIHTNHPVYAGSVEQAMFLASKLLDELPDLKPSDIAVLCRQLNKQTVKEINKHAGFYRLEVQCHSSRADHALERTLGQPPIWKAGKTLNSLYALQVFECAVSRSLRQLEFSELRALRPLATAADALDTAGTKSGLTFFEAWTALKKTTDREVQVSAAVASKRDALQVMTIHAAKGLEFPVVILMKLSDRRFPNREDQEDSRLVYVGATRARDVLIATHIKDKPKQTLRDFGNNIEAIHRNRRLGISSPIEAQSVSFPPPIIAATDLDLYEQCPLKFAAYHEGRFLPEWTSVQSRGARMHKAIEHYLRAGMPEDKQRIDSCFEKGFSDGDWPSRKLPAASKRKMSTAYHSLVQDLLKNSGCPLRVEHRYRYLQGNAGQIDGVVDAVIERRDGTVVLCEWKSSKDIAGGKRRQYELQVRAGALGLAANGEIAVQRVEIRSLFDPKHSLTFANDESFIAESIQQLDRIFKDVRDRQYKPQPGDHCEFCPLKRQCPAQT